MLRPASLSKELLTGLLRGKLGFNGLISTDATPMVGFTAAMKRSEAIVQAINAGCDMILFNKSLEEDFGYLLAPAKTRNEAVLRILATKASLGLHKKKAEGTLVPEKEALEIVGCEKHKSWAKKVADQAITLVRDEQELLPISPKKYKRVYLNVIQKDLDPENAFVQSWKEKFEQEDFVNPAGMTPEKGKLMHEMYRSVEEMKQDYDLYVYICNMENASNNTTLRLNWNVCFGLGDDAPWFAPEIPALMISTAYPFHLFDAPMVKTYINTYSGNPEFIQAAMDKIMGRSEFTGVSPADPLCGKNYI